MYIKRLTGYDIPAPVRETEGAAGYDLRCTHVGGSVFIAPGERKLVDTGFAWEIPHSMVGLIRPRSGLACREGLHVMAGVVDSDYRGEVKVLMVNLGDKPIEIKTGDRIAQMVVVSHYGGELIEVDELTNASRGEGGFGSTGKK